MDNLQDNAIYRFRRVYRSYGASKEYREMLEVIDDRSQQVLAACNHINRAIHSPLDILDDKQRTWRMSPNRKIMPSRWIVTDPQERIAMQFDQKILGKLTNPLYKVVLALLNEEGEEVYRLVDPRTNIPDRIFGLGPAEWAITEQDKLVARLVNLPRRKQPAPGLFGRLKSLFAVSDPGIVSMGGQHIFPAPVALGMRLLFKELTDVSGIA